ncbi:MAG: ATP-binding protein [Pseudobdellovibrionaceae bacterium]|nr:ATP-binding protein [Pseudobdellovibrionaceae bacterium]
MKSLLTTYSHLINYTTDREGLGHGEIKKIRMTNIACGLEALNLISLTITLLVFDIYLYFPMLGCQLIGLVTCILLMKRGRYTLAKIVLYTPIILGVAIACAGFEPKHQIIVYGFPLTIALFLIFDPNEKVALYSLLSFSIIILIGGNLAALYWEPIFVPANAPFMRYFSTVASSQALVLSALIYKSFFDENFRSEKKIMDAAHIIYEQKVKLQAVFDSVEEAILTINSEGLIQEGFSSFTEALIGRSQNQIIGQNALDLFVSAAHHDRDQIDQCRTALEMSLGSHIVQWEVNRSLILTELEFTFGGRRKFLNLNWQPIVKDEVIIGFLLLCRDVSIHHLHDQMKQQEQERAEALLTLVSAIMKTNRQAIEGFLSKSIKKLSNINPDNRNSVLFELHTVKGVARSLGLQGVATEVHGIETTLASEAMKSSEIGEKLQALVSLLEENQRLLMELVGNDASTSSPILHNLYDLVSQNMSNLYSLLEKHQIEFESFHVDDRVWGWSPEALECMNEALLHAVTNTIDHGFVFPKMRQEIVAAKLKVQLKAWMEATEIVLEYSDNGNGVDDKTLERLAEKYNMPLSSFSNPLEILFEAGVSNATGVSLTSGRGVGTAAIKAAAEKLRGTSTMRRNSDRGLTLQIRLPRETCLFSTHTIAAVRGRW